MSKNRTWLAALGLLLAAGIVTAQQLHGSRTVTLQAYDQRSAASSPASTAAMQEDIEVFRRMLDRALLPLPSETFASTWIDFGANAPSRHFTIKEGWFRPWQDPYVLPPDLSGQYYINANQPPVPGGIFDTVSRVNANYAWDPHAASEPRGFEGTYLKGHGIVYSGTLPLHYRKILPQTAQPARKEVSEWDKVRNELRGEKTKTEEKKQEQEDPSVADLIFKLLAENGRHFSQLSDDESLTIAVTLRPMTACAVCHDGGTRHSWDKKKSAPEKKSPDKATSRAANPPGGSTLADVFVREKQATDQAIQARKAEAANFTQLGEQRLKQNRFQEAADSYQKAVAVYEKLLELDKKPGQSTRTLETDRAAAFEVAARLAQAYVGLGDSQRALQALQRIAKPAENTGEGQPGSIAADSSSKAVLPAKLVVSVPKRMLVQVGNAPGQLNYEDFKKGASLEYLTPSEPKKDAVKPAATAAPGSGP
jgi:tetratricopeptide (TPR) repeat protein